MNGVQPLKRLNDAKKDILLAEATAWLHDMGKCTTSFITNSETREIKKGQGLRYDIHPYKAIFTPEEVKSMYNSSERKRESEHDGALHKQLNGDILRILGGLSVSIFGQIYETKELILLGTPGLINLMPDKINNRETKFLKYLGRCHGAAHMEKEEGGKDQVGPFYLSSPFGFEKEAQTGEFTNRLLSIPWVNISDREIFRNKVKDTFQQAFGDTRRPLNEVTLWDWSHIVAALFKAALAGTILGASPNANELRWRLLGIRFDGMAFFGRASRVPDLLARKEILEDGLERVRILIEEEYPLGTEVYRDANGSVFVVPDVPKLLELQNENGQTLKYLVEYKFSQGTIRATEDDGIRELAKMEGEVIVEVDIDDKPWWGQAPLGSGRKDDYPHISDRLASVTSMSDPDWILRKWDSSPAVDTCTVCGLRPQGPSQKSQSRNVCDICESRREDRSVKWIRNPRSTIWIDEVADINGRVALITGKLEIRDWIGSDSRITSLIVNDPLNKPEAKIKTPSFARVRRVWKEAQDFFEEIAVSLGREDCIGTIFPRLIIIPSDTDRIDRGRGHAYELTDKRRKWRIAVVWDENNSRFVSADNLQRIAILLTQRRKQEDLRKSYCKSAAFLMKKLLDERDVLLEESTGYGKPPKDPIPLRIGNVEQENMPFVPGILIAEDPGMFMALAPAKKAINVIRAMKQKYEDEIGKVQNRLPLITGAVFFDSRTTLSAALDAGRRMLVMPVNEESWEVAERKVEQNQITLKISKNNRSCSVKIPTVMGDGTGDWFYPYWQVEKDKNGNAPAGRARQFKRNPTDKDWIHVCDLEEGDKVIYCPSRFDFEFLDSASRRFEIDYETCGSRRDHPLELSIHSPSPRPYFLSDIETMERIWEILRGGLKKSQIHQMNDLIQSKWREWKPETEDRVFEEFIESVILGAEWTEGTMPRDDNLRLLVGAAISGMLSDSIELHLEILKESS